MDEYLQQLHSLCTNLKAVGEQVKENDLVAHALLGLPEPYNPFITAMNTQPVRPSFAALRPLLLSERSIKLLNCSLRILPCSCILLHPTNLILAPTEITLTTTSSTIDSLRTNLRRLQTMVEDPMCFQRYKCYNPEAKRVLVSRHVVFNETVFPYQAFHSFFKNDNSLIFPSNYQFSSTLNSTAISSTTTKSSSTNTSNFTSSSFLLSPPSYHSVSTTNAKSQSPQLPSLSPSISNLSPASPTTIDTNSHSPSPAIHSSSPPPVTLLRGSNSASTLPPCSIPTLATHPMVTKSRNGISML
ncbi:hypothetical protein LIER_39122 [Lithospermum erythrorhizon]|uniref:Retroviral polymerase SH3-like domain-containing protein n=1 Tax=Lithospermum erythrorhizon TaxID=34254 RepID=A0AAV3QA48_LITER